MIRTHTTPRPADLTVGAIEPARLAAAVAAGLIGLALLTVGGCGDIAKLTVADGTGPSPVLPAPTPMKIPTVEIADAVGWAAGEQPLPAAGLAVNAFASDLDHPRWLLVLANGDVLVAETNRPPNTGKDGLKAKIMGALMKKAGAGVPSPDRIKLLRDADGDGTAETREVFASNLTSPFGMVELDGAIYVANTDGIVKFDYASGDLQARAAPRAITALPAGELNHHWTKSLVASPDGQRLYAGVGSNSNVAEAGMAVEEGRAAIHEIDLASGATRIYASGLRNPVGMDFEPVTGKLWVAVNERDALGSDLVPDYMTAVTEGGFYGWPWSYYGQHIDPRLEPVPQDKVASAIVPDYALGPHTGSLGLAFYDAALIPSLAGAAIVGQHGSWNRQPPSGYGVIAVPFANGQPAGQPRDLLTGFLDDDGQASGRPVGVAVARDGAILVADDVGNTIWRITPAR